MSSAAQNIFAAGVFLVSSMVSCMQSIDRTVADGRYAWEHRNDPVPGSPQDPRVIAKAASDKAGEQTFREARAAEKIAKAAALVEYKRAVRAASSATGAELVAAHQAQASAGAVLWGEKLERLESGATAPAPGPSTSPFTSPR